MNNLTNPTEATKDIKSEQVTLGCMLIERDAIIKASAILIESDFYEPQHRQIFHAIMEMFRENKPVEPVSLYSYLTDKGNKIPFSTLQHLIDLVSTAATVEYYAQEVRKKAIARRLTGLSLQTIQEVKEGKESSEIIKKLSDRLKILTSEAEFVAFNYDTETIHEVADELNRRMERYNAGEKITGLRTGFPHLDNLINGLQTGLYILGAPPSVGKTTFCKQLADQVAWESKIPVIFVSYEQSKFEMIIKSLSRIAKFDSFKLQKGNIDGKLLIAVENDYYNSYAPYIITIEGDPTTYIDKIRSYALCSMSEKGTAKCLLIIDYLQLVPTREFFRDKRTQIDRVLSDLRRLARELDSPVWAVSSFARESYKNGGRKPTMASFKESGGIEYTADVAILMETEKEDSGRDDRTVHFRICKHRGGTTGKIIFKFTPAFSKFEEISIQKLESNYEI